VRSIARSRNGSKVVQSVRAVIGLYDCSRDRVPSVTVDEEERAKSFGEQLGFDIAVRL